MGRLNDVMRWGMILFFLLGSSHYTFAKSKTKKSGHLSKSINDAMERSDSDQEKIKYQMNDEADKRIDTWADRERVYVEIKHSGSSSGEPVRFGDSDTMTEDSGIDQSGLDNLHTEIEDEPINIDFDKELRDVSSLKD